jgi:hypothetical protein
METKSFKDILGYPRKFPLELTLTTGERHVIPHPDYAYVHPDGTIFLFLPQGPYEVAIDPRHIVKMRPARKRAA